MAGVRRALFIPGCLAGTPLPIEHGYRRISPAGSATEGTIRVILLRLKTRMRVSWGSLALGSHEDDSDEEEPRRLN